MKISMTIILIGGIMTLSALVQGQEDPDYISVDCGAPNDYHDKVLDIYYKGDAGFVDSGENRNVSSQAFEEAYIEPSKTLRIFPNGTRNCYTLRPKQGKGNKYSIRASFLYGNYDGKNQPPQFHLYIDTNYWTTVNYTSFLWNEVIYVAPRDYIQICLVNIGLGVPYISLLELRLLDSSTYNIPPTSSRALYTYERSDIGSMSTFNFSDDGYGRIWIYANYTCWRSVTNTTPIASPTTPSNKAYKVPEEVLMTAQETSNTSKDLSVYWPSEPGVEWYAYFHFAEVRDLKGRVREMDIYMNDKYVDRVRLQNQVPWTTMGSVVATGPVINITLNATSRSELPPLLNALEVFNVLNLPSPQTHPSDFDGINAIKTTYEIDKESWQGDPCVPPNMTWEGLICNYDNNVPRIVSLNLSSSNLVGTITASFSNLTAIAFLDLSYNNLGGSIPDFLAKMAFLKTLNLASNNLSGFIPKELLKKNKTGELHLSLDGNHLLSWSGGNDNSKKVVIIVVAMVGSTTIAIIAYFYLKKKAHGFTLSEVNENNFGTVKYKAFTFSELLRITNNFEVIIGEGGFGKVYLGTLEDGSKVAVKMLSQTSKQGNKEFQAEARLLMIFHHRNLVTLVGYCDDLEHIALVYEYMSRGDLRQWLMGQNLNVLTWRQRVEIAIDAAQGLEYLHNGCKPSIVHRDLKTSNVLLNERMQAKIADFGLSREFVNEFESYILTRPAGTPGYLDPEYHSSGNLSKKSDIYSFGIILLELISGHPAIIRSPEGSNHILQWITPLVENGDIERIIDPRLQGTFDRSSALKMIEVAMACAAASAIQRPNISSVLSDLSDCLAIVKEAISYAVTYSDLDDAQLAR